MKDVKMEEEVVIIVGAGQSGLAVAACLAVQKIPSLILERDDCVGSLWRNRCYDRVSLHLAKQYCQLPLAPHPPDAPMYLPKGHFVRYLEDYAARFHLRISFQREVISAEYDEASSRWRILARNREVEEATDAVDEYSARYLVVATGENDEVVVPAIPGMVGFGGHVVHSSRYRSGSVYNGLDVLVVGSGNSGMEIAYDLVECGARPTIVVRNQLHIVSRNIWLVGMILAKILPCYVVDTFVLLLCYMKFGDTAKYGFHRPNEGPMYLKIHTPTYPIVDIGTLKMVKSGKIQVRPALKSIKGNCVTFSDGMYQHFDAIILATGYRSAVKQWLKGDEYLIGDDGMAKQQFPNHWKGRNGLYSAGFVRRGIYGSGEDAESIAKDISSNYHS